MTSRRHLFRKPSPFVSELMSLFRISRRDAALADRIFTSVSVPEGSELAWEGSTFKQLVLVLDGEVEILRDGARVDLLGPGGVIGEVTALGAAPFQTASARTTKPSRIAAAGIRDLAELPHCTGLYLHLQHLASKRTVPSRP